MIKRTNFQRVDFVIYLIILVVLVSCISSRGNSAQSTQIPPDSTTSTPKQVITKPPISTMTEIPTSLAPTETIDLERKVGTDIFVTLPEGDIDHGKYVAIRHTCMGCHEQIVYGPNLNSEEGSTGIFERAESRIAEPDYAGSATTAEEYIIESILIPEAYIVPGDWARPMDGNYGELLSVQDLAGLLAYLQTFE
jgi:hypothetical protein